MRPSRTQLFEHTVVRCRFNCCAQHSLNPTTRATAPSLSSEGVESLCDHCREPFGEQPRYGGDAKRLTNDISIEIDPRFSPEGTMVAFTGEYDDGNEDVYLMPSTEGLPKRRT
jgi:hypothetical protein